MISSILSQPCVLEWPRTCCVTEEDLGLLTLLLLPLSFEIAGVCHHPAFMLSWGHTQSFVYIRQALYQLISSLRFQIFFKRNALVYSRVLQVIVHTHPHVTLSVDYILVVAYLRRNLGILKLFLCNLVIALPSAIPFAYHKIFMLSSYIS